jgi:hypothetical protein
MGIRAVAGPMGKNSTWGLSLELGVTWHMVDMVLSSHLSTHDMMCPDNDIYIFFPRCFFCVVAMESSEFLMGLRSRQPKISAPDYFSERSS